MASINEDELAVKILSYLDREGFTVWGDRCPTMQILNNVGLKRNAHNHGQLMTVLGHLVRVGLVTQHGIGKFSWRRTGKDWYRDEILAGGWASTKQVGQTQTIAQPNPEPIPANDERLATLTDRIVGLEASERWLSKKCAELESRLAEVQRQTCTIEVRRYDGGSVQLTGEHVPEVFAKVLSLAACRRNILLVGPAGCGKTTIARLVAKALDLPFNAIACTAGMSETKLLGKSKPNVSKGTEHFQSTDFLDAYEGGGVFLLDELDAADSNMMLSINSALANGYATVPNRAEATKAVRHKDFICIGTANTYGRGATRTYSGRNQLDEATVDRFRIGLVECDYDKGIEAVVCPDKELRELCQQVRAKIEAAGLRRVMSTRFMEDAYIMKSNAGWKDGDIMAAFFSGWSKDELEKVSPRRSF